MKPKTKKVLIIGGIALVVLILIVVLVRRSRAKAQNETATKANTGASDSLGSGTKKSSGGSASKYVEANDQDFSIYTKGKPVRLLQAWLNQTDNAGLTVDGAWGPATQRAVEAHVARLFPDKDFGTVIQCRIVWTDNSKTTVAKYQWF